MKKTSLITRKTGNYIIFHKLNQKINSLFWKENNIKYILITIKFNIKNTHLFFNKFFCEALIS